MTKHTLSRQPLAPIQKQWTMNMRHEIVGVLNSAFGNIRAIRQPIHFSSNKNKTDQSGVFS
jgi:hypothetical protein